MRHASRSDVEGIQTGPEQRNSVVAKFAYQYSAAARQCPAAPPSWAASLLASGCSQPSSPPNPLQLAAIGINKQ